MEELVYIIDLLKEFWLGDPNMDVHVGFWGAVAKIGMGMLKGGGASGAMGAAGGGGGGGAMQKLQGMPGVSHAQQGGAAAGLLQVGASLIGGRKEE